MRKTEQKEKTGLYSETKEGFTLVEVMLVVGIAGLMLLGIIGGMSLSINQQRYNDALRSFAEYLRTVYSEAQSPESLGYGNSETAVLGKLVVFGYDYGGDDTYRVYSATIVGDSQIPLTSSGGFMDELRTVNARLVCGNQTPVQSSTVEVYVPLWETRAIQPDTDDTTFQGAFIIAHAPTSGAIHTAFSKDLYSRYNLRDQCAPDNKTASSNFEFDIQNNSSSYKLSDATGFCVKADNVAVSREIRLAADARNTSGISILEADNGENKCR